MSNLFSNNNKKFIYFKEINKLAFPIIISSLSAIFINLIDEAIIGRLSINTFAGVNLVISIINSLIGVLGVVSVAFNILGSKNKLNQNKLNSIFSTCIVISIIIGIIFFILTILFCKIILTSVFGLNGTALVEATTYIKIFSLTILLNLIIFVYSSVFKIFRKTTNILIVCLFINLLNSSLDFLLVFGEFGFPKLGAKGAAIGTVISLVLNIIIYHLLSKKHIQFTFKINDIKEFFLDVIKISLPIMGQEFFEDMIFVYGINIVITRLGVLELSTYSLLLNIFSFLLMPMFAYSTTSITLVSESFSEDNSKKCKDISIICSSCTLIIYIISILIILLLNTKLPSLFTDNNNLINSFMNYISICSFIQIFNIIENIYKSSLQAIGNEKWVLKNSIFINIVTLILIFIISKNFGLFSIYILLGINYIYLSIIFFKKYKKSLSIHINN